MNTIRNKSHRAIGVPLPHGKKLFLGPGKSGQISAAAAEHPPLRALIDAGELELLGEGEHHADSRPRGSGQHESTHGFRKDSKSGRRGDR